METLEKTCFNRGIHHNCSEIVAVPLAKGLNYNSVIIHCSHGHIVRQHNNDEPGGTIEPGWSRTSQPRMSMGMTLDIIPSNERPLQRRKLRFMKLSMLSQICVSTGLGDQSRVPCRRPLLDFIWWCVFSLCALSLFCSGELGIKPNNLMTKGSMYFSV